MWILAMILVVGKNEVIIKPYAIYNDQEFGYYSCISDRDELSKELKIPMTCVQEKDV